MRYLVVIHVPYKRALFTFNDLIRNTFIIRINFETFFLSTPPWDNPDGWKHKRLWIEKYFGNNARHKLILTARKDLNIGDYLVDDRTANGAGKFYGEHIHFLSDRFKNWSDVVGYLMAKK